MILEVSRLFGGFLLAPSRIPNYFAWLDALSYFKYTYVALSLNELEGLQLKCDNRTQSCIHDGQTLIEERGFNYINISACIGVLLAFIFSCRIIAYIAVRFLKH
jgi:ATP-binding cassette subfamily G (WHITE) protein 2